jgi:5'-nucleotidase
MWQDADMSACHLRSRLRLLPLLAAPLLVLTACSDDDGGDDASDTTAEASSTTTASADGTTTTVVATEPLRILVTNDDGIEGEGLDALVGALTALPDTEVHVVAPAEDQTGSSDATTPDPTAADGTTLSGHEGTAVAGEPADTIVWARDNGWTEGGEPHLVISGINAGQNIGPLAALSGTVGAARQAARFGVPALAVSQGVIEGADGELTANYPDSVDAALAWLEENRADLLARDLDDDAPALVTTIDAPTCPSGEVRGTVEVSLATAEEAEGINAFEVDCESTLENPTNDVVGLTNGYIVVKAIPVDELDALLEP